MLFRSRLAGREAAPSWVAEEGASWGREPGAGAEALREEAAHGAGHGEGGEVGRDCEDWRREVCCGLGRCYLGIEKFGCMGTTKLEGAGCGIFRNRRGHGLKRGSWWKDPGWRLLEIVTNLKLGGGFK